MSIYNEHRWLRFFHEWCNRTWEGFPLFVTNYGVGIGNGDGGLGFKTH